MKRKNAERRFKKWKAWLCHFGVVSATDDELVWIYMHILSSYRTRNSKRLRETARMLKAWQ